MKEASIDRYERATELGTRHVHRQEDRFSERRPLGDCEVYLFGSLAIICVGREAIVLMIADEHADARLARYAMRRRRAAIRGGKGARASQGGER